MDDKNSNPRRDKQLARLRKRRLRKQRATRGLRIETLEQRQMLAFDALSLADVEPPQHANEGVLYLLSEANYSGLAAPTVTPNTIVFVDSNVGDYQSLLDGLLPIDSVASGTAIPTVKILEADRDGVQQITDFLSGYEGVSAIHILSHGSSGSLQLGNTHLDNSSLERYSAQLNAWGLSLTNDGDILLYGCNVAEGQAGEDFVQSFAASTGADVAASDNVAGNEALGGDSAAPKLL
jgi:hypothetical protein